MNSAENVVRVSINTIIFRRTELVSLINASKNIIFILLNENLFLTII